MLRGMVDAKDGEVGWSKATRVWGSGDERVVGKVFELLLNAGRLE